MIVDLDRRVLAGIRLRHGLTGTVLTDPMHLSGNGLRFVRNRSGVYGILSAPGFSELTRSFQTVPDVATADFTFTIAGDQRWLPRLATLSLPRPIDPEAANSVFAPVELWLAANRSQRLPKDWPQVSLLVHHAAAPVAGAVVEIIRAGQATVRGLTDATGQAVLAVPGVAPLAITGVDDAVSVSPATADATLRIVYDPAVSWPMDPDDVLSRAADAGVTDHSQAIVLQPARTTSLTIDLP